MKCELLSTKFFSCDRHLCEKIFDARAHMLISNCISKFELECNEIGMVLSGVKFVVFIDQYRFVVHVASQRGVSFSLQTSQLIALDWLWWSD